VQPECAEEDAPEQGDPDGEPRDAKFEDQFHPPALLETPADQGVGVELRKAVASGHGVDSWTKADERPGQGVLKTLDGVENQLVESMGEDVAHQRGGAGPEGRGSSAKHGQHDDRQPDHGAYVDAVEGEHGEDHCRDREDRAASAAEDRSQGDE